MSRLAICKVLSPPQRGLHVFGIRNLAVLYRGGGEITPPQRFRQPCRATRTSWNSATYLAYDLTILRDKRPYILIRASL